MTFGDPHIHHRRTDSTNARARELAEQGADGGLVVTADEQTAGRGRQGRSWIGPPGKALLYSALIRPLGRRPLLPLAVPLAVAESAEAIAPVRCQVKWPNDVWIEGRKAAGVLIEARPEDDWAVVGVGLNVAVADEEFPDEIRERATSVGNGATVESAREALNERLGEWVEAEPERVLAAYRQRDALRGRRIEWDGGSGLVDGIDNAGHLVVRLDGGGTAVLGAGEVHLSIA